MSEGRKFIRGHKTMLDGTRVPITADEAEAIWAKAEGEKRRRAAEMTTSKDALDSLHSAMARLEELGWRRGMYCPKDGTPFAWLEFGSTGTWMGSYSGKWPDGHILAAGGVDRPEGGMWKPLADLTAEEAKHMHQCDKTVAFMEDCIAQSLGAVPLPPPPEAGR